MIFYRNPDFRIKNKPSVFNLVIIHHKFTESRKSPIFCLQKLLGRSVDIYVVVFNDEREPHPLPSETGRQSLTWGWGGLFRKKRQASIIEGDFVKKMPYQMYLKNFS